MLYRIVEKRKGIEYEASFHLEKWMLFFWCEVAWSVEYTAICDYLNKIKIEKQNTELYNYETEVYRERI